jgi:hypothetical protein
MATSLTAEDYFSAQCVELLSGEGSDAEKKNDGTKMATLLGTLWQRVVESKLIAPVIFIEQPGDVDLPGNPDDRDKPSLICHLQELTSLEADDTQLFRELDRLHQLTNSTDMYKRSQLMCVIGTNKGTSTATKGASTATKGVLHGRFPYVLDMHTCFQTLYNAKNNTPTCPTPTPGAFDQLWAWYIHQYRECKPELLLRVVERHRYLVAQYRYGTTVDTEHCSSRVSLINSVDLTLLKSLNEQYTFHQPLTSADISDPDPIPAVTALFADINLPPAFCEQPSSDQLPQLDVSQLVLIHLSQSTKVEDKQTNTTDEKCVLVLVCARTPPSVASKDSALCVIHTIMTPLYAALQADIDSDARAQSVNCMKTQNASEKPLTRSLSSQLIEGFANLVTNTFAHLTHDLQLKRVIVMAQHASHNRITAHNFRQWWQTGMHFNPVPATSNHQDGDLLVQDHGVVSRCIFYRSYNM